MTSSEGDTRGAGASERAEQDLEQRTLSQIRGRLAQLIYVASTRDYRTGKYQHDGLAWRFSEQAAETALLKCHERLFDGICCAGIEETVAILEEYLEQQEHEAREILKTWKHLPAYAVVVPLQSPHLCNEMFLSNIRIALQIIEEKRASKKAG